MKNHRSLLLGAWFLLGLNLLLAIGTVVLLNRMTPAIAKIISENDQSLAACEEMLAILACVNNNKVQELDKENFYDAIQKSENNITEKEEVAILVKIRSCASSALKGNPESIIEEIKNIKILASINRMAMESADKKARKLGVAGAWGAVFLASISFISGLFFICTLNKHIFLPLEELYIVLKSQKRGDAFRRCSKSNISTFFRFIYNEINSLIDRQKNKEI